MAENPATDTSQADISKTDQLIQEMSQEPAPSYVKLAMRNMVRKGGKSLFHFGLTVVALIGLLVGLSYLTH